MKKFRLPQLSSTLGIWSISLITVASVPIFLANWPSSAPSKDNQLKPPPLPPLSQLPSSGEANFRQNLQKPVPQLRSPEPVSPPKTASKAKSSANTSKNSSHPHKTASVAKKHSQKTIYQASAAYQPPQLEIRVAVLQDVTGTTIGTSNQAILADRNGTPIKGISGGRGLWLQPEGLSLSIEGQSFPGVVWLQPATGSLVYVGDRWYRGKLLLVSEGSSLLVVNYVDIEDYLYSVVGSEMHPNAPIEALKAQAIAARSYALVHIIRPASPWYDLGNSQRWQVYKGLYSEYNTTLRAVNETSGQILSYQGGVVESLYAATDEIVSAAHGGRGMSQTGAYDLAKQGMDYQQILDRYYPGVGLARLILNQ